MCSSVSILILMTIWSLKRKAALAEAQQNVGELKSTLDKAVADRARADSELLLARKTIEGKPRSTKNRWWRKQRWTPTHGTFKRQRTASKRQKPPRSTRDSPIC